MGLALAVAFALVAGLVPLPGWAVALLWSLSALALAAVTGAAVWLMLGVLDGISGWWG